MLKIFLIFISTLSLFLIIDGLWIGFVGSRFYNQYIPHLMSGKVSVLPALLFYLMYIAGMMYFVILPALDGSVGFAEVLLRGALLGLFAYGTYDLTNHVFMKQWPWFITITDILWGAFVTGTVCALIVKIFR